MATAERLGRPALSLLRDFCGDFNVAAFGADRPLSLWTTLHPFTQSSPATQRLQTTEPRNHETCRDTVR